jgi:hypothetical protein
VAAADVSETARLLREVSLPLVWSCEATAVGGAGGAVCRASGGGAAAPGPGAAAAAGNGHALPLLPYHGAAHAAPGDPAAAAADGHDGGAAALLDLLQLADAQQQEPLQADGHNWAAHQQLPGSSAAPTRCLQTLLTTAALAHAPSSTRLLRLLLPALPTQGSPAKQQVLLVLAKSCIDAGRVQELQAVLESQGRSPSRQRREFVASLVAYLQLPHRPVAIAGAAAGSGAGCACSSSGSSSSSSAAPAAAAAANEHAIAAVLALMQEHGFGSMLAAAITHSYLSGARRSVQCSAGCSLSVLPLCAALRAAVHVCP